MRVMAGGNDLRDGATPLYLSVQGREVSVVNDLGRDSRGEELATEPPLRTSGLKPAGERISPV
jgi:hypothetical protein